MKNLVKFKLNRFLFFGLFASQIFLVNCDSKAKHSVKAFMPNSKQNVNVPPCTDKVMSLIGDRQKAVSDLQKSISDAKGLDLTAEQKANLNKAIDDLKTKSNLIYVEIRSIKTGGTNSVGCNSVTSDGKKAQYLIVKLQQENQDLAKQVSALTKESNSLMMSDEDLNKTTVIENQSYNFKEELAKAMTKDKINFMYVLNGTVHDGSTASDELKLMIAKRDSSFCYLETTLGDSLKDSDEIRVVQIRSKIEADKKSASSQLFFGGSDDKVNIFQCVVQKTSDIPTEIRSIFGELLVLKNGVKTQTETPQADSPKTKEKAPETNSQDNDLNSAEAE